MYIDMYVHTYICTYMHTHIHVCTHSLICENEPSSKTLIGITTCYITHTASVLQVTEQNQYM